VTRQLSIISATSGSFKLSFDGDETIALDHGLNATNLKDALVDLMGIESSDINVLEKNTGLFEIEFVNHPFFEDITDLVVTDDSTDGEVIVSTLGVREAFKTDFEVTRIDNDYIVAFQGKTRQVDAGPGVAFMEVNTGNLVNDDGTRVVTRMEGINYYGIEDLNILLGSGTDVMSVQGTSQGSYKYLPGLTASVATSVDGDGIDINEVQRLRLNASGTFTLSLTDPGINGGLLQTTSDISLDPQNLNPDDVAQAIEDALNALTDVDVEVTADNDKYTIEFLMPGSPNVAELVLDDSNLTPIHAVTNISLGDNASSEHVFVSSNADLDLNTIFDTDGNADAFDFLTGNLDDMRGDLNIIFGDGRHGLMVSDEASTVGDDNIVITDTEPDLPDRNNLNPNAEIWMTGLNFSGGINFGSISYEVDPSGDLHEGIVYWTGSGDDTITIDGTHARDEAVERTTTLLNTGLGDDHVTVDLDQPEDGFFVLHTQGGSTTLSPVIALSGAQTDDDTVRAADSTLPLIIFGGLGNDDIIAGQNEDVVFGDLGRVQYLNSIGELIAVFGFGGREDMISSQVIDPTWVISRDLNLGGVDILEGSEDDDILIGGAGGNSIGDYIDGDEGDDLIFGDAVRLERRDTDVTVVGGEPGSITNPRYQALLGQVIYTRHDLPAYLQGLTQTEFDALNANNVGEVLVDGQARDIRHQDGSQVAAWNEYEIVELYHSFDIEAGLVAGLEDSFGEDYIAGGSDHDVIFGQLGDDVIQGDGSIESAVGAESLVNNRVAAAQAGLGLDPVGAQRVQDGTIDLTPTLTGLPNYILDLTSSFDAVTDGDDYIEGNGGNDVVFGNLGQDDIIGGSSSLFTLDDRTLRPDGNGSDILFGGSGTRADHDADVQDGDAYIVFDDVHARDADVIAGDNANIYRIVGTGSVTPPGETEILGTGDTGGFLEFGYDAVRGATVQKVIVRAVELLDYTLGGPDFRPDLFDPTHPDFVPDMADIGGDDEIHGESGDDFIYGMVGKDILFGDSEDDDIIGGWGNDWISGGQDMDGVIGDDGRIFTARYSTLDPVNGNNTPVADPNDVGDYAELLNGILKVDELDKQIDTPGNIQVAIINPSEMVDGQLVGEIFKIVDLTPFNLDPDPNMQDRLFEPLYANDMIFGGRGNDFLHGGAGDDAMLGAEALLPFFIAPINPDDPTVDGDDLLRFNPDKIEFADYDEEFPRMKLENFVLNFDPTGDPNSADIESNDNFDEDQIFGDLGNDWLVGGPDNDNMFGGWGNDLLNADDNLETNGNGVPGDNYGPDPINIDIQDRALGGAGRDVLIANTGGDRLIDWIGEFNSFIVPFAPFGEFTVTRAVFPALFQFLYDLSASLGADPSRAADTGNDAARNGEPDGELGLVTQKDGSLWQDQTGAPIDPQPGNIPGGQRLTLRGVDFNSGTAEAFAIDSGNFQVNQGSFQVSPTTLGGDASAVLHVGEYLPNYFEVLASISTEKPIKGYKANSYVIFDYVDPTDFKYAGINISTDKLEMGYRDAEGWHVTAQTPARLRPNTNYDVMLAVNGLTATLVVGNDIFSHTFTPRTDPDGFTYGLNYGMVGLGANNAIASIDNVIVQILKPETTFEHIDDFSDGVADDFMAVAGSWQVAANRFTGIPELGEDQAFAAYDLDISPNSILELEGAFAADNLGGIFFDHYSDTDYKFAGVLADTNEVVIGHFSKSGSAVYDAIGDISFAIAGDYDIRVSLKGTTVSVAVMGGDDLYHEVVGHTFNAVTVDGSFGLMSMHGQTSFDNFGIRTDDPAFDGTGEGALMAAQSAGESTATSTLTHGQLEKIFDAAVTRWTSVGCDSG
jgi:hypothetical protein